MAEDHEADASDRTVDLLARGRHHRYWIGRREGESRIVAMDEDYFPPGNQMVTALYAIDPEAGTVTPAGLVDPYRLRKGARPLDDRGLVARALALFLEAREAEREREAARSREAAARREAELARRARMGALRDALDPFLEPMDLAALQWSAPRLGAQDLRLALEWYARGDRDRVLPRLRAALDRDLPAFLAEAADVRSEVTRIVAARAAELVVRDFLEGAGLTVRDIAVTQLRDPAATAWRTHDLEAARPPGAPGVIPPFVRADAAGTVAIDVKSARRPQQRRGRGWLAVRQIVHKGKRDAQAVALVGVIAPYLPLPQLLPRAHAAHAAHDAATAAAPEPETATTPWLVTGWTSLERLAQYRAWCEGGLLEFEGGGRDRALLAPWAYETAPAKVDREALLAALRRHLESGETLAGALGLSETQQTVLAITLDGAIEAPELPPGPEREFIRLLQDGIARFGRVLPVIHLAVVRHFIACLANPPAGSTAPFDPRRYVDLLWAFPGEMRAERANAVRYPSGTRERFPLGVPDPERTTATLLEALEALWGGDHARLREYDRFTLSGTGILRGRRRGTAREETVLAYCGGVDEHGPCGVYPLVAGVEPHCPNGYLRCSCGFCCHRCDGPERERRPVPDLTDLVW